MVGGGRMMDEGRMVGGWQMASRGWWWIAGGAGRMVDGGRLGLWVGLHLEQLSECKAGHALLD